MKCACRKKSICKGLILFVIVQIVLIPFVYKGTYLQSGSNDRKVGRDIQAKFESMTFHEGKQTSMPKMNTTSPQNDTKRDTERINGYQFADTVRKTCVSRYNLYNAPRNKMHFIRNGKVKMCAIEKIGSTFWRRVFAILITSGFSRFKTPFDIPPGTALQLRRKFTYNYTDYRESEFSFMFVRNPWSRLLSTFIDKLVPPNPFFWDLLGKNAVKKFRQPNNTDRGVKITGHDVTFSEYVQYVIYMEKSINEKDGHVQSIKHCCQACNQSYTFIGRMEQFKDDSFDVLKEIGLSDVVERMNTTFEALSAEDAIADTIKDAFSWKRAITKVITWDKALKRLWLKLQMRGLISAGIDPKLNEHDLHRMRSIQFLEMAKKAHRQSDPSKLKEQKDMVKKEAFDSVPLSVLKHFASVYIDDFTLFGYEPYPSKYFNRDEQPILPNMFFNYNHLN
ncbi:hypothetical protein ACF0H5_012928 [Mactra antiquata]